MKAFVVVEFHSPGSSLTWLTIWSWLLSSCLFPSTWSSPQRLLRSSWHGGKISPEWVFQQVKAEATCLLRSNLWNYTSLLFHILLLWFNEKSTWVPENTNHWRSSEAFYYGKIKQTKVYTSETLYLQVLCVRLVFYITL